MEIPQNEGFIMENPFNMDYLGVPHFSHLHTARRVDKKKRLGAAHCRCAGWNILEIFCSDFEPTSQPPA